MLTSWTVIFCSLAMLVTAQFYQHNQQQQKNQGYERGNVINIFVYHDDLEPSSYVQRAYNWQQENSRTSRKSYYNPSIPEYHSSGPYHYQPPQPSYYPHHHHHVLPPYEHQYLPPPPSSHSHHQLPRPFSTWSGQTFDGNFYPVPNFNPFCNNYPQNPQIHLTTDIASSSPAISTATVEAFQPVSHQSTDVTGIINEVLSSVGAQPSSVMITKGSPSQLPAFVDNQLISGIIGGGTASPTPKQQFDRGQPQYIQQTLNRPFPQNQNRPNLEIITSRPPVPSGLNIGDIVGGVFPGFEQQTRRPAPSRKPTLAPPKPKVEIPRTQSPPSTNINNIIAGIFPGINTQDYQQTTSRQPTIPNRQSNQVSNENQSSPPPTNINNIIAGVFPTVNQQTVPQEVQPARPDINSLISSVFPGVSEPNGSNGKPNALPSIPVFQPDFPSSSKTKPKPDSNLPLPLPSVGTITSTSEIPVFQPNIATEPGSKNGNSNGDNEGPVYDIDIRFGDGDDDANRRKRNMHK